MVQHAYKIVSGRVEELVLPGPHEHALPNIKWGNLDVLFSPAFWATQSWQYGDTQNKTTFRLGRTLTEEIAACLLGGYGIPSEVGNMAFEYLRKAGCFSTKGISREDIYTTLSAPMPSKGKLIRYRFAKQKSSYLYDAIQKCESESPPANDALHLRDWLLQIKGIGPKTASWIVRNWLSSDDVAILDIHIYRAGLLAGFYKQDHDVSKHYYKMEELYLNFAKAIEVKASLLDAVIWQNMKILNQTVLKQLRPSISGQPKQRSLFS